MKIAISSDPRLLHILRGVVRWHARESGLSAAEEDCLAMAIDEAAANVIRHTYGSRTDAKLALEIRLFPNRIEFVLEDCGPKVSPQDIRPRALEDVRPGGLGTYFIRCFMDETHYEDCCEGNRLRMVKYLSRRVASGDARPGPKRG